MLYEKEIMNLFNIIFEIDLFFIAFASTSDAWQKKGENQT